MATVIRQFPIKDILVFYKCRKSHVSDWTRVWFTDSPTFSRFQNENRTRNKIIIISFVVNFVKTFKQLTDTKNLEYFAQFSRKVRKTVFLATVAKSASVCVWVGVSVRVCVEGGGATELTKNVQRIIRRGSSYFRLSITTITTMVNNTNIHI